MTSLLALSKVTNAGPTTGREAGRIKTQALVSRSKTEIQKLPFTFIFLKKKNH